MNKIGKVGIVGYNHQELGAKVAHLVNVTNKDIILVDANTDVEKLRGISIVSPNDIPIVPSEMKLKEYMPEQSKKSNRQCASHNYILQKNGLWQCKCGRFL